MSGTFSRVLPKKSFWNVFENHQQNVCVTVCVKIVVFKFYLQRRLVRILIFLLVNSFVRLTWEFQLTDINSPLIF